MSVKNIIYMKEPVATATQRSSYYLVCSLQLGPQKVFMEGGVQPAGPCFSVHTLPLMWMQNLAKGPHLP